jgi:hypothetical protein
VASIVSLPTMEELLALVHKTLCEKNCLDPEQAPLRKMVINRRGRPCGMFFEVAGTRLMRNYAVWAGDENRILFYDSSGERYAEVRLSDAPDPLRLAG